MATTLRKGEASGWSAWLGPSGPTRNHGQDLIGTVSNAIETVPMVGAGSRPSAWSLGTVGTNS